MQLKKSISQVVKDLINSGNITQPAQLSYPTFEEIDVYPTFRNYFTDKAASILHNKVRGTINQYNEKNQYYDLVHILAKLDLRHPNNKLQSGDFNSYTRKISIVRYFGLSCGAHNLQDAVNKMIANINDMAENEYINATLAPFSIICLSEDVPPEERLIIVSYLAVKEDCDVQVGQKYAQLMVEEGNKPNNVEAVK